jgi:hypothetical protein
MNNLHNHALAEFRAAGWTNAEGQFKDEMQQAICEHVLKLIEVFANEGHSGSTAPYAIDMFKKLAMFEPLVPLTGEDWEWNEVGDGVFQNKRCSRVFKQADRFDGQAYDIDGIVFFDWHTDPETGEKSKSHYTDSNSRVPIMFPYTPKTEYKERTETC